MAEAENPGGPKDGKSLDDFVARDTPYAFVVEGAAIERFVQMTNWDYLRASSGSRALQMSGVERAINEAGAGEGDRVGIGKYEFDGADRRSRRCSTVEGEAGREARGDDEAGHQALAALIRPTFLKRGSRR